MKTLIVPNDKFVEFSGSVMNNPFIEIHGTSVVSGSSFLLVTVDAPDFAEFPDYVKVA